MKKQDKNTEILNAINDIKSAVNTINDCQDLWLSDVRKLDDAQSILKEHFGLKSQKNDKGYADYWADYVFADDPRAWKSNPKSK